MAKPENENALTKGQSASLSVGADGVAFTRNLGTAQAGILTVKNAARLMGVSERSVYLALLFGFDFLEVFAIAISPL
ncbi:MAG: hypothetical protein CVT85_12145 [Alphaproteobacteria bacterium HGW-Alphaproteobacteria-7]|jgi:hypothetical protein|nr:MAG: hypothetical protein CVT85_12145 [Alphaproteobacteria bacterium HGW-Alphaproteobacteria-7]